MLKVLYSFQIIGNQPEANELILNTEKNINSKCFLIKLTENSKLKIFFVSCCSNNTLRNWLEIYCLN